MENCPVDLEHNEDFLALLSRPRGDPALRALLQHGADVLAQLQHACLSSGLGSPAATAARCMFQCMRHIRLAVAAGGGHAAVQRNSAGECRRSRGPAARLPVSSLPPPCREGAAGNKPTHWTTARLCRADSRPQDGEPWRAAAAALCRQLPRLLFPRGDQAQGGAHAASPHSHHRCRAAARRPACQ